MLETIISSKTRLKLLLKFFLNKNAKGYLRGLEQEFGESTNAIRLELNKFESAGLLSSEVSGNKRYFKANEFHPLFENLHGLVMKYIGIDRIIQNLIGKLGDIDRVYLVGDYAEGRDTGIIDLFIVAQKLDFNYFVRLLKKVEEEIERKIRYAHFENIQELEENSEKTAMLLLWQSGEAL